VRVILVIITATAAVLGALTLKALHTIDQTNSPKAIAVILVELLQQRSELRIEPTSFIEKLKALDIMCSIRAGEMPAQIGLEIIRCEQPLLVGVPGLDSLNFAITVRNGRVIRVYDRSKLLVDIEAGR